jgi:hypothetical protein
LIPALTHLRRRAAVGLATIVAGLVPAAQASATAAGGWTHLGHGATASVPSLNGAVAALNSDAPGVLYVGGTFLDAGGHAAADRIASWDGNAWRAVSSPTSRIANGFVDAIAYDSVSGHVFAGGTFTDAGDNSNADYLAVWNGAAWTPFCDQTGPSGPSITGSVSALQIIGRKLYVAGSFTNGAGIEAADYLVACSLDTGDASAAVDSVAHAFNGGIDALIADSNGTLYAGGGFTNLAGIPAADHIASTSGGGAWDAMGSGPGAGGSAVDDYVRSLTAIGTDVYVATDALDVAGIARADHVARWNGSAWSALGSNTAGANGWFPSSAGVYGLTDDGINVYATGSFQDANGDPLADQIAYFDGSAWHHVGSNGADDGPWSNSGAALASFDQQLIAGGNFTSAGGDDLASRVASFPILRPDARIGSHRGGPFLGDGVYDTAARGESKTISVARGGKGALFANIQNDGLRADNLRVQATGKSQGFTVQFFRGSSNVTSRVRAGSFATGSLAPGASLTLKIAVQVTAKASKSASFLIHARSKPGAAPDAVKAKVKAK